MCPPVKNGSFAWGQGELRNDMDMEISECGDAVYKVSLRGRLDTPGVDKIEARFDALVAPAGRAVMVDLSNVPFLASMGIRMLITAARTKQKVGGKLVLYGTQPLVREVFDHVALDQIIPIVADEHQAMGVLQS